MALTLYFGCILALCAVQRAFYLVGWDAAAFFLVAPGHLFAGFMDSNSPNAFTVHTAVFALGAFVPMLFLTRCNWRTLIAVQLVVLLVPLVVVALWFRFAFQFSSPQ